MKKLRPINVSLILIHLLITAISLIVCPSGSIQFQLPSFNNTNLLDIRFVYQGSWYTGQNASLDSSALWLTPNPIDVHTNKYSNIGKFVYKDPIHFKYNQSSSPSKVVSFNTSFTFQIITTGPYDTCGSGITFFISAFDKAPIHSDGRSFGLVDPNATTPTEFFAVEFDTRTSTEYHDPSGSHIGIDINSLISLNYTDTSPNSSSSFYPQLYLYNNYTFTAWIEYNSLTTLIQVWMTNSSNSTRPSQACLQLSYDLSTVFQDFMYVGFSATNKAGVDGSEGHVVYSWSFTSEDIKQPTHLKVVVPIAITLSILFALGAIGVTLFLIKKKRKNGIERLPSSIRSHSSESSVVQLGSGRCSLPRYSYKELKRSAHNFSEESKIGEGGFSSVYKATLADGSMVAIKRLKEGVRKEVDFSAELNIISSIRHRNLLQLRGWCYEKGEAMLVYRYISNGSLESYLYGKKKGELHSETRLKILVGVASALEYLHGNLGECVVHRDVKAANVLLTEGFEPMLGDFGLARLIGHDEGAVTMTAVGTPGYVAPEVIYTGRFTEKADVYSFGVLALEMAYGRPAMARSSLQPEEARIADYAWMLHQRDQLMDALDPSMILNNTEKEQWSQVLHVALMCCNPSPKSRPTMRQVYQTLKGDSVLLMQQLPTKRPSYPTSQDWPSVSGSPASLTGWTSATNSRSEESRPSSTTSK